MTNREIAEKIFEQLKENGFKAYNVSYGDSYFIFQGKPDSVVHFRLKGVDKHWKFGMWLKAEELDKEEDPETKEEPTHIVRFFCQWDRNIDKFKPSASSLLVEIDKASFDYEMKDCFDIVHMVKFIKKHKLLAYAGFCGQYAGYYAGNFLREYISTEWHHKKEKIKKAFALSWALPLTKCKIYFAKKSKIVKTLELHNFQKENPGWSTSYLYSVNASFKKDADEEAIAKWVFRWFPRRNYGKFGYYDYVISAIDFSQEGVDGYFDFKGRK